MVKRDKRCCRDGRKEIAKKYFFFSLSTQSSYGDLHKLDMIENIQFYELIFLCRQIESFNFTTEKAGREGMKEKMRERFMMFS